MTDSIAIEPIRPFRASLTPPGSKSLTNRALLLAALSEGECTLTGVLFADDTRRMLEALKTLGFKLDINEPLRQVRVTGQGGRLPPQHSDLKVLNLGNAGTAMRFLAAMCCLNSPSPNAVTLDGIARMRERPIGQLVEPLREIGGHVGYGYDGGKEGFPPLRILPTGLRGGELAMSPTLSSQYVSALLQIAPCCDEGLILNFQGPVTSRPYVEMTLRLMRYFGIKAQVDEAFTRIAIAKATYRNADYAIEPDASNASYFLAAAAILPNARCTIEGLGKNSLQGDIGFADVLHRMGADLVFGSDFLTIIGPPANRTLRGIDVDLNAMPDMAQTLAAVALFADGTTTIRNVGNLRVKETDRLDALRIELTKLGAKIEIEGDDIAITPPVGGKLKPAAIDTYDDHRMAMSFAIVGLRSQGVRINDPSCVNKTFPDYFEFLERLRQSPMS